ncbi:ParB/RepB/Spo0J family partition protein (plasmid) [Robbsia andropogonis]|uniref:ParB/RepB/Spo0J family partition protein n=1 Tax=Robbsia andropogonis TaxID=28092 RepID=UPI003D2639AF
MAKHSSDDDFVKALRSRDATAPRSSMVLNTPPVGPKKSLDDVLAHSAQQAESASTEPRIDAVTAQAREARDLATPDDTGRFVALDLLEPHEWNARVHRPTSRINEIAASIASDRQHMPLAIVPNPSVPGRYYILDGETRYWALKALKRKEAWVIDADADAADPAAFYFESFKRTDETVKISAIDQGIKWAKLIEGNFATPGRVAAELSVSPATVSRMIAYAKFSEPVLDFMHAHADRFPYSVAAVLAPLAENGESDEDILNICQKVVDEQFSRRLLESFMKERSKADNKRPRKSALFAIPIKAGKAQVGSFRTYENGALEFKVTDTNAFSDDKGRVLPTVFEAVSEAIASDSTDFLEDIMERLRKLKAEGSRA